MTVLRALLLLLCVLAAAHLAAVAEFNPALATLAARPDESLLATGKALTKDASEEADVTITNRALAEEGEQSAHDGAVRVLAEDDLLSLLAEGSVYADVADTRRSLKKKGKKSKGKKCRKYKKGKKNEGAAAPGGAAPAAAGADSAAPGGGKEAAPEGLPARSMMAEDDLFSQLEGGDADVADMRRSLKRKKNKCKGKKCRKYKKGKKGKKNEGAAAAPGGAAPGAEAPADAGAE
ncbi:unnamed protein product [Closterium sp. NIES-53]